MITAPDEWFQKRLNDDNGIFDRPSFEACMKVLVDTKSKMRTALDIGAHCGSWSIALARRFKTVYAYEPEITNFLLLHQNLRSELVTNCVASNVGVGLSSGRYAMKLGTQNSGQHHMSSEGGSECILLPLDVLHPHNTDIDFLKIDVEGFEPMVLLRATELLERNHPVICLELNGLSERYGFNDDGIRGILKRLRYKEIAKVNKDYIYTYAGDTDARN